MLSAVDRVDVDDDDDDLMMDAVNLGGRKVDTLTPNPATEGVNAAAKVAAVRRSPRRIMVFVVRGCC